MLERVCDDVDVSDRVEDGVDVPEYVEDCDRLEEADEVKDWDWLGVSVLDWEGDTVDDGEPVEVRLCVWLGDRESL